MDTLDAEINAFFNPHAGFDMEYGHWIGDAEFRESDVKRDEEGKFATQSGVANLPEGKLPSRINEYLARGDYHLSAAKQPPSKWGGHDKFDVVIHPDTPPGIKTVGEGRRREAFDPELAESYIDWPDEPELRRERARVKEGLATFIDDVLETNPEHMYRGISSEEFDFIRDKRLVQSKGAYNIGKQQEGLTYWSTDAGQAGSYANSFAPTTAKATFAKPAYVVVAKRVGDENLKHVEGTGKNELGVNRAVDADEIVEIWRGRVAVSPSSDMTLVRYGDGDDAEYRESSGGLSTPEVVWERVPDDEMFAAYKRPLAEDAFREEDVTRDPAGKFSSTGGGALMKTGVKLTKAQRKQLAPLGQKATKRRKELNEAQRADDPESERRASAAAMVDLSIEGAIYGGDDYTISLITEGDEPIAAGLLNTKDGTLHSVGSIERGHGKAILKDVVAKAKAAGLKSIYGHALKTALPFYEKLGFKRVPGEETIGGIRLDLSDATFDAALDELAEDADVPPIFDREFREEDVNRDPEGKFAEQAGGGKAEETKSVASRERDLSVRDILYGDFPKEKPRSKQVKDVARQLMERGSTALKALGIESGRIEGPNPETDEMLSRVIASEISDALSQTGSATDWYTHRVTEAMNIAAEMYPELAGDRHARTAYTAALAVTSQGEVVPSNVRLADQVYRHYRETGRFPTNVQAKERISMNTNFRKLNGLLDAGSPAEMTAFLNQDFTVRELGTLGYEVGGENVNTQVKGSAILGAKIGQGFFQNLNGNYDPVTMDLWFMRGWGRLTGTLQGQLDPGEFSKTRNRFENALREAGETPADSPPALKERAQEISAQHERDYRKYRAEFDSGERKKSELVLSAQRMVYAMDGINQAPRSGGHREWMRSVINRTREVLAEQGTTLTNADIQATWWYPEKSLYEKLGSREARDINVDYSDALQDLARKHGISEEAIARAVRTVDRRPGRAAARDQRGGGEGVWTEGNRAAAAQALDYALDRAIAGFFGYDREFKEHEVKRDEEGKFATQASTRSFVSPSVAEGLSLSQARQALGGRRQQVLAQVSQRVDRRLGLREARNTAVIGAWADGAENSLMTVTSGDPQLIRAAAAIKGAIANQKAVLVFQPGEGEHEMASFAMQGDIADIHNRLLQGGLQFHTLEPTEDGAKVHILVMDDETAAAITEVAGDTEIETVAGNGEFIGTTKDDGTDAEQRSDAQRAYREAIDQVAEQRQGQGPDLREIWSDNVDYWRAETAEAADRGIAPDAEFREENVKRDKAGKFAKQAGGGKPSKAAPSRTPDLEQQRETGKNFVQHQRMIAAMQAMNKLPEGMRRPADVMLDYGRQFYFDNDSFECPKGKRHMCYENAGMAAILDPDLTYVEGHVLVNGIPIEHAWNTDQNGKVIDPTITDPDPITGYFGLPIETAYLRKTIQRTKMWGMLDPMYNEERLYDDPEDYVKKDIGLPLPKESQEEKEQLDKLLKMWRGGAQDREFRESDVKRDEGGKFAEQASGAQPIVPPQISTPQPGPHAELRQSVRDVVKTYETAIRQLPRDPLLDLPDEQEIQSLRTKAIRDMVDPIAKRMGVDPNRVTVTSETYEFALGDRKGTAAGTANRETGEIKLYNPDPVMRLDEVIVHEMMHVKWQNTLDRMKEERSAWIADSRDNDDARPREERVMDAAGYMTDVGKKKYPLAAANERLLTDKGLQTLRKEDGITDYSREWWQAFEAGKADIEQAVHETLAEMAKLDYQDVLPRLLWFKQGKWKSLYNLTNKTYKAERDPRGQAEDAEFHILGDKRYRQWRRAA